MGSPMTPVPIQPMRVAEGDISERLIGLFKVFLLVVGGSTHPGRQCC